MELVSDLVKWGRKAWHWGRPVVLLAQTLRRHEQALAALHAAQSRRPRRPLTTFQGVLWAKVEVRSGVTPDKRWEPCCPVCADSGREMVLAAFYPDESDFEASTMRLECRHPEHGESGFACFVEYADYRRATEDLETPLEQLERAA